MRTGQSHRWLSFPPKRPTSDCVTDPITHYRPSSPPAKLSPQTPVNDYSTMPQPAKAKQPPQTHPYRTKPSLPQLPPKTPGNAYMTNLPPTKQPSQTSLDFYRKIPLTDLPVSFFTSKDPVQTLGGYIKVPTHILDVKNWASA